MILKDVLKDKWYVILSMLGTLTVKKNVTERKKSLKLSKMFLINLLMH